MIVRDREHSKTMEWREKKILLFFPKYFLVTYQGGGQPCLQAPGFLQVGVQE